jgi:hypothetical protein
MKKVELTGGPLSMITSAEVFEDSVQELRDLIEIEGEKWGDAWRMVFNLTAEFWKEGKDYV